MLGNFPMSQPDELLGSLLARSVRQFGIAKDKVALEYLFGSRNVVPSALFQGHIWQLLNRVGHLWRITPDQLVHSHSMLPLFRPFTEPSRYQALVYDLISVKTSPVSFRSGINASLVRWPTHFRVCLVCWYEQKARVGFSYWQRLLQAPGVECCPTHQCNLIKTELALQPARRHHFVGAYEVAQLPVFSTVASLKEVQLARGIEWLLSYTGDTPEIQQWSAFYAELAKQLGYVLATCIDHSRIRQQIVQYWGGAWLEKYGLTVDKENHWLLAIFRTHRRAFNYLQHIACWMALTNGKFEVSEMISCACAQAKSESPRMQYFSPNAKFRKHEYRQQWREQLHRHESLKAIRAEQEGARLYSWLYRYDHDWWLRHKLPKVIKKRVAKVDWSQRDKKFVRALLNTMYRTESDLALPRRSQSWYARQVNAKALFEQHWEKLPLCLAFINRYAESVDEYQTRRLACVMIELIKSQRNAIARSEIERLTGLSKERCRLAVRRILECDLPTWQSYQKFSDRSQA